jgi:hypothetical protein
VDLRREELKLKLDNCSDEIIQSIDSTKDSCITLSKESKRLSSEIGKSNEELTELIEDFDTFEIDIEKFEEIKQSLTVLNVGLNRKLGEHKNTKIGGKVNTFQLKDIDIKGLFGSFKEV